MRVRCNSDSELYRQVLRPLTRELLERGHHVTTIRFAMEQVNQQSELVVGYVNTSTLRPESILSMVPMYVPASQLYSIMERNSQKTKALMVYRSCGTD